MRPMSMFDGLLDSSYSHAGANVMKSLGAIATVFSIPRPLNAALAAGQDAKQNDDSAAPLVSKVPSV